MASNPGDLAVNEALKHVGKQYVWATRGPDTFDCAGLVYYAYLTGAGKTLPTGSLAQSTLGTSVAWGEWKPGDILLYDWFGAGRVSHVALYIGNGQIIEALNESQGVVISDVYSSSWQNAYRGARRPYPYNQVTGTDAIVQTIISVILSILNKPQTNTHRVTENVNMRSGAGTNFAVKGVVQAGQLVNVLNPTPVSANGYTWYNVKHATFGEGWIIDLIEPV